MTIHISQRTADFSNPRLHEPILHQDSRLLAVPDDEKCQVLTDFSFILLQSDTNPNLAESSTIQIERNPDGGATFSFFSGNNEPERTADSAPAKTVQFIDSLKKLDVCSWREEYPTRYWVLEGYVWYLQVFSGDRWFHSGGQNAYPPQLPALYSLLTEYGVPSLWDSKKDGPYYIGRHNK